MRRRMQPDAAWRERDDWQVREDATQPTEQPSGPADADAWFAERGFRIVPSPNDYSSAVRSSPWGKKAPSRDQHVWVDLARADGTIISSGYGAGRTLPEAVERARRRWQAEQEDRDSTAR
jgi:hypothetical protein